MFLCQKKMFSTQIPLHRYPPFSSQSFSPGNSHSITYSPIHVPRHPVQPAYVHSEQHSPLHPNHSKFSFLFRSIVTTHSDLILPTKFLNTRAHIPSHSRVLFSLQDNLSFSPTTIHACLNVYHSFLLSQTTRFLLNLFYKSKHLKIAL